MEVTAGSKLLPAPQLCQAILALGRHGPTKHRLGMLCIVFAIDDVSISIGSGPNNTTYHTKYFTRITPWPTVSTRDWHLNSQPRFSRSLTSQTQLPPTTNPQYIYPLRIPSLYNHPSGITSPHTRCYLVSVYRFLRLASCTSTAFLRPWVSQFAVLAILVSIVHLPTTASYLSHLHCYNSSRELQLIPSTSKITFRFLVFRPSLTIFR